MHSTNTNSTTPGGNRSNQPKKPTAHSTNGISSYKWVSKLRTLPSNPNSNDFLKLEYIDVNLNNSRKLINNVGELSENTRNYVDDVDLQINGNLIQLNQVKLELQWLDELK